MRHRDRMNSDEPAIVVHAPPPPDWLSERAREFYLSLSRDAERLGVMSDSDGQALALTAHAADEFLVADEQVTKYGLLIKRTHLDGIVTAHLNPAVRARQDAWRRYSVGLRSFGLDPQSRATVRAVPREQENPFEELKRLDDDQPPGEKP
jgi:P27 family predicted phage terminase small subunit